MELGLASEQISTPLQNPQGSSVPFFLSRVGQSLHVSGRGNIAGRVCNKHWPLQHSSGACVPHPHLQSLLLNDSETMFWCLLRPLAAASLVSGMAIACGWLRVSSALAVKSPACPECGTWVGPSGLVQSRGQVMEMARTG